MKSGGRKSVNTATESPAKQIAGFIGKFEPKMQKLIRSLRGALRQRFPTAFELVYDNYNFLVFGFCSAPRASDCVVSLAADANRASLCFTYGAKLADPDKLMHGGGNQVRFLRLEGPTTLKNPGVEALLKAAEAHGRVPMPPSGEGPTIVRSISAKQRPRRKDSRK